jgi:hypothetical protein
MTTFHPRHSDCGRRVHKKANASAFNFTSQIPPSIYAVMHTKHDKRGATIFKSRCSRMVLCYRFDKVEALPLVSTRFLRLAHISPKTARSPARWARDGRKTSGKKSGEMSHVVSAQRPGNGRTVATAMPPNVRPDDSQDNLPCAGQGRAMSAWKLARQPATWPRNSRETSRKMTRQNPAVMFLTIPF